MNDKRLYDGKKVLEYSSTENPNSFPYRDKKQTDKKELLREIKKHNEEGR